MKAGVIATSLLSILVPLAVEAQAVRISSPTSGQGLLRGRGHECFVITPSHVVGRAAEVTIVGSRREVLKATVAKLPPDSSFAVLLIRSGTPISCPEWSLRQSPEVLVNRARNDLWLRYVSRTGELQPIPVTSFGDDAGRGVRIRPVIRSDHLFKGMSGSQLMAGDQVVGLLQRVDASGAGVVSYLDVVAGSMNALFPPNRSAGWSLGVTGNARLGPSFYGGSFTVAKMGTQVGLLIADIQYQYASEGGTYLKGANGINDVASSMTLTIVSGPRILLPTPVSRASIFMQGGLAVQRESVKAHELRYADFINTGGSVQVGLSTLLGSEFTIDVGLEGQMLWVARVRETEVETLDRSRSNLNVRAGFTRYW